MEAACASLPKEAVTKAYLISPAVQGPPQNTERTGNNLFSVLISFFISLHVGIRIWNHRKQQVTSHFIDLNEAHYLNFTGLWTFVATHMKWD